MTNYRCFHIFNTKYTHTIVGFSFLLFFFFTSSLCTRWNAFFIPYFYLSTASLSSKKFLYRLNNDATIIRKKNIVHSPAFCVKYEFFFSIFKKYDSPSSIVVTMISLLLGPAPILLKACTTKA